MTTRQATHPLEARLGANPDSLAFPRLADYYLQRGEIDRAIETCLRGVDLHPHNTSGRIVLGRCLMGKERFKEAIGTFAEVCRLDPRNSAAMKFLGDLFARQGSGDLAGDLYRLVSRMDPFDTAMASLAGRMIGSGKTDLFDILNEGVENAEAGASEKAPPAREPGAGIVAASEEILETVEADIEESAGSSTGETFSAVEITGSDSLAIEPSGKNDFSAIPEPSPSAGEGGISQPQNTGPASTEILAMEVDSAEAESATILELSDGVSQKSDAVEATLPVDSAAEKQSGSNNDSGPATPKNLEIPDGLEISSRLDTLFGDEGRPSDVATLAPITDDEKPVEEISFGHGASDSNGMTGDRLFVDAPAEESTTAHDREIPAEAENGKMVRENLIVEEGDDGFPPPAPSAAPEAREHEELFLDSRDLLLVEEDVADEQQPLIDDAVGEDLLLDRSTADPAPKAAATRSEENAQGGDSPFERIEIATLTLAEIYFKQGQLQRALAIYRRLLEKEPGSDPLKEHIKAVNAAIASGGEGIPTSEQERGKASRKISEDSADLSALADLPAFEPALDAKPKEKAKFKWIKKPNGER